MRWALRLLHGVQLPDRVYGPETTIRLCAAAARAGVGVYLYGAANEEILGALRNNLVAKFPDLKIVGAEVPPFRALAPDEDAALVERINDSGAGLVLIPTCIWAWVTMDTGSAIGVTVATVPILLIDNVLKPFVMAKGLKTPMLVIFVGVIGGTLAYGLIGLFLGPIVLAVFYELLVAWVNTPAPGQPGKPLG